jgi:uncharacterized protein YegJ (DUF2314 family)
MKRSQRILTLAAAGLTALTLGYRALSGLPVSESLWPWRREPPVSVPLPPSVGPEFVVYFRPLGHTLPTAANLRSRVRRWVEHGTTEPTRTALRAYIDREMLDFRVGTRSSQPAPSVDLLRTMGAGSEELRRLQRATHRIVVLSADRPGPPHYGLWSAIASSRALAGDLGGVILDPELPRLEPLGSHSQPLPPELRVQLGDHIVVPYSMDERGLGWMTTNGMRKFGLPDLQIEDFPPNLHDKLAILMNGMARRVFAELRAQTADRPVRPEVLQIGPEIRLSLQDFTAEGEPPPKVLHGARGWTRVRLRYDPGRNSTTPFLTLLPPRGFRGDQGVWLNALLTDLFGAEDTLRTVDKNSSAMEAAHQRAVEELPVVKQRFQRGLQPEQTLFVKYAFPTSGDGHEYMWIAVNTWKGGRLRGQLANDPQWRRDLRAGQTVELDEKDVFDWMIQLPDGHSEGGYTTTVVEREGRGNGH